MDCQEFPFIMFSLEFLQFFRHFVRNNMAMIKGHQHRGLFSSSLINEAWIEWFIYKFIFIHLSVVLSSANIRSVNLINNLIVIIRQLRPATAYLMSRQRMPYLSCHRVWRKEILIHNTYLHKQMLTSFKMFNQAIKNEPKLCRYLLYCKILYLIPFFDLMLVVSRQILGMFMARRIEWTIQTKGLSVQNFCLNGLYHFTFVRWK